MPGATLEKAFSNLFTWSVLCHEDRGEVPALPEAGIPTGETHGITEARMEASLHQVHYTTLAAVCQVPRPEPCT